MDSPFKVDAPDGIELKVAIKGESDGREISLTSDKSCMDPRYDNMFQIEKSTDFSIKFKSNNINDRIYLEDLYFWAEKQQKNINVEFKVDERSIDRQYDHYVRFPKSDKNQKSSNVYSESIMIFENDQEHSCGDIMPGVYGLRIVANGVTYYGAIEIILKDLIKDSDWMNMRNDLENSFSDITMKNDKHVKSKYYQTNQHRINELKYEPITQDLIENGSKLEAAIRVLPTMIKFQVDNNYDWKKINSRVRLGAKTYKKDIQFPSKSREKTFSIEKKLNYNIPVNQYMKYILKYFLEIVEHQIKYFDDVIDGVESKEGKGTHNIETFESFENECNKKRSALWKLKSTINFALSKPLFSKIEAKIPHTIPKSIVLNTIYGVIFKKYNSIKFKEYRMSFADEQRLSIKSTFDIYEMWAGISIVSAFEQRGYNTGSWEKFDNKNCFEEGSHIELTNENKHLKLLMTYNPWINNKNPDENNPTMNMFRIKTNEKTDKSNSETNTSSTYSEKKHNHPDYFIEVFTTDSKEEKSLGSIVLDTKYRPKSNVLYGNSIKSSKCAQQFLYYRYCIHSDYPYLDNERDDLSVMKVYCLLPSDEKGSKRKPSGKENKEALSNYLERKNIIIWQLNYSSEKNKNDLKLVDDIEKTIELRKEDLKVNNVL
ncbi:hypothetical protein [Companilactobacillus furfuricola]|uniref:hypothetical protein n=1 Tax=Companilactobacillus furfuricola TaxID=1462575 RepID=UPI000F76CB10|nr:hypothetical protein [Companilactobacillus furfuricola]